MQCACEKTGAGSSFGEVWPSEGSGTAGDEGLCGLEWGAVGAVGDGRKALVEAEAVRAAQALGERLSPHTLPFWSSGIGAVLKPDLSCPAGGVPREEQLIFESFSIWISNRKKIKKMMGIGAVLKSDLACPSRSHHALKRVGLKYKMSCKSRGTNSLSGTRSDGVLSFSAHPSQT